MRRSLIALPLALLPSLHATSADSATASATFQVQINIQASCTVVSATAMDFGTVGVLSAAVTQTSSIAIQCTASTPYDVGLSQGLNGGSVLTRQMSGGGGQIGYSLYRDAARTLNWGETLGADTVSGTGNGAAQTYTVYGRVPAQTTPSPGLYTDTITVTVTY
jgi:spore coat protein U-like protein